MVFSLIIVVAFAESFNFFNLKIIIVNLKNKIINCKMAKPGASTKFEMLNEVQIAEIREIFTLFDKNSDGYVET